MSTLNIVLLVVVYLAIGMGMVRLVVNYDPYATSPELEFLLTILLWPLIVLFWMVEVLRPLVRWAAKKAGFIQI